ncbi:MAG: SapC family protein [Pseudomonadota bacterium]
MADTPANATPNVTGNLPLYKNPQPLNITEHKGKGLKYGGEPFAFLRETHFVPLTVGEFGIAATRYPIIFLGDNRVPVAAMGLQAGQNLMVTANGEFEENAYVPAFVRRYPFVAASHTDEAERFTVCVDSESHLFSDQPDQPFFNDDGTPTDFTQRAIDFVRRFEGDAAATNSFVARMKELDLFDKQEATFQPRDQAGNPVGEPQIVASYWGISGDKLKDLSGELLVDLRDNTYLGAIYAHMLSMSQWEMMIARAGRAQQGAGGAPAMAPPPAPEQ